MVKIHDDPAEGLALVQRGADQAGLPASERSNSNSLSPSGENRCATRSGRGVSGAVPVAMREAYVARSLSVGLDAHAWTNGTASVTKGGSGGMG